MLRRFYGSEEEFETIYVGLKQTPSARNTEIAWERVCCHSARASGITVFLENGGSLEAAQRLAPHSSAKTTKLYDRTDDRPRAEDVERIFY